MENERKAAAREYVEKFGLSVLLLEPNEKEPATTHGSKDASNDWKKLEWAYRKFNADYNIGIATGSTANNLIVIDCDVDAELGKDGWDWLLDWQIENGELPETATVETGRGGKHLYFWNKSGRKIKNSANADIAIDVRGEGGYVMAPPSIHPNGKQVFWDLPPDEVPIADANELVLDLIDELQRGRNVFDDCFVLPKTVRKGERNDKMFGYGRSLWAKSAPPDELWAKMKATNAERFKPPIKALELKRIYYSVMSVAQGYSDEVKEQQEAKAKENHAKKKQQQRGRSKTFDHAGVSQWLIDEHDVCKIGGAPAIKINGVYQTGWNPISSVIYDEYKNSTMTNHREVHAYLDVKAPERELSPWNLIAFQNGVFDLKTGALREFADDDVFTNVIPHNYNADVDTSDDVPIIKFLLDIANGDDAVYTNLLEVIGLCFLHVSRYEFAPVLLGRGSNGKSTFMDFLRFVVGKENVSLVQPEELNIRFQKLDLVGKLANLSDDIANGYLDGKQCAEIKRLATGEPTRTDVKGSKAFNFTPCCTMIFSANTFPRLADTTDGMMRRLFPIEFTKQFKDAEKQPHLIDELCTETNAERAIVDALMMLSLLVERGSMTPNETSIRIKREIVTDNSTVLQWVDDLDGWDALVGLSKELAYESYEDWARKNGVKNLVNAKTMCQQIKVHGRLALSDRAYIEDDFGNKKRMRVFGYES